MYFVPQVVERLSSDAGVGLKARASSLAGAIFGKFGLLHSCTSILAYIQLIPTACTFLESY